MLNISQTSIFNMWNVLEIHPVLSVVLPLFLPFLPNFIRTPQNCRPKIKVGLNYITKCYLLSMD